MSARSAVTTALTRSNERDVASRRVADASLSRLDTRGRTQRVRQGRLISARASRSASSARAGPPHEVVKRRVIFLDDGRQTVPERGHHASYCYGRTAAFADQRLGKSISKVDPSSPSGPADMRRGLIRDLPYAVKSDQIVQIDIRVRRVVGSVPAEENIRNVSCLSYRDHPTIGFAHRRLRPLLEAVADQTPDEISPASVKKIQASTWNASLNMLMSPAPKASLYRRSGSVVGPGGISVLQAKPVVAVVSVKIHYVTIRPTFLASQSAHRSLGRNSGHA